MASCTIDDLVIPKTETDITEEWITKAVGIPPLANSMSVTGNIQDGVGFLSNLCRVSFQTEAGAQNILVKLLPTSPDYRALTLSQNFDEREIQFYTIVYPRILEIAPELKQNMVSFYCGKVSGVASSPLDEDYSSMLVMEDLRPQKYQMLNPECDKWEENLGNVVKFLAKFHCAGLALEQSSNKLISDHFPFCMGVGESKLNLLLDLALTNATRLDLFLEENNSPSEIRAAYKEITANVQRDFELCLTECSKNCVLIHGDVWPPNVMVCDDSESPVKIIDWQLLGYRDPTVEITVAILTCLPKGQLNRENVDKFRQLYYDTCKTVSNDLPRSEDEYKKSFDTWGMVYAYHWFLLSLDSFPNDMKKLIMFFEFLQKEYNICEFMKRQRKV